MTAPPKPGSLYDVVARPRILSHAEWMLVGARSCDSLLVRGGDYPVAIRVSHPDSGDLIDLLTDANMGAVLRHAGDKAVGGKKP